MTKSICWHYDKKYFLTLWQRVFVDIMTKSICWHYDKKYLLTLWQRIFVDIITQSICWHVWFSFQQTGICSISNCFSSCEEQLEQKFQQTGNILWQVFISSQLTIDNWDGGRNKSQRTKSQKICWGFVQLVIIIIYPLKLSHGTKFIKMPERSKK